MVEKEGKEEGDDKGWVEHIKAWKHGGQEHQF